MAAWVCYAGREMHPAADWSPNRPVLRRLLWYRDRLRRGGFTTAQAMEELEVGERTVHRDVAYLETLAWEFRFCRQRRRWVADGELPLPLVTLREGEAVALLVAEQALRVYAGTPLHAPLRSAFEKIASLLDAPIRLDLDRAPLPRFTGPPVRPVEAHQYDQILSAYERCRRLEIVYHSLERNALTTRRVDPYGLYSHAGDWYLVAFDHHRAALRDFALGDRMREVRETGETFARDAEFDLERYLAGAGFWSCRSGEVEEVALRFQSGAARYLREKTWADGERKEELPDGSLLLRMCVPVNIGLLRFVLQYGAEVEVLAPPSLRQAVRDHAAQVLGLQ